jgi:hypothetical protein
MVDALLIGGKHGPATFGHGVTADCQDKTITQPQ